MSEMLDALRDEAKALARLPSHHGHPYWSINANAGTVTELNSGRLVAYLHPAAIGIGTLAGWWYLPHDKGTT